MNENSFFAQPENLLSHGDFIRGIARSLLFDEHEVDEVVQKTWMAALQNPPEKSGSLRAWLGSVVRNQAAELQRREARLDRREKASAKPELIASTAEIVELETTRREVVDTVLQLEEPYRSVILFRFYDDLPPREIAEKLSVPVETVRTRIKRGLELLRAQLDKNHGGDRRAWCLGLVPFAASGKATKVAAAGGILGGFLIGSTAKLIAALLVVTAGLGTLWLTNRGNSKQTTSDSIFVVHQNTSQESPSAATDSTTPNTTPPPQSKDSALAQSFTSTESRSEIEPAKKAQLWGKVTNEKTGEALPGSKVVLLGVHLENGVMPNSDKDVFKNLDRRVLTADSKGDYRIEEIPDGIYVIGAPSQNGFYYSWAGLFAAGAAANAQLKDNIDEANYRLAASLIGTSIPRFFAIREGDKAEPSYELPIALKTGAKIQGRVLSTEGNPIAKAEVVVIPASMAYFLTAKRGNQAFSLGDVIRSYRHYTNSMFGEASTNEDGSFALTGLADNFCIIATAPGYFMTQTMASSRSTTPIEIALTPNPRSWTVQGNVVDADSRPVAGARVFLSVEEEEFSREIPELVSNLEIAGRKSAVSAADGAFSLREAGSVSSENWVFESEERERSFRVYAILGDRYGSSEQISQGVASVNGIKVVIDDQAEISGIVIDDANSLPIANVNLKLSRTTRKSGTTFSEYQVSESVSGSDGKFTFSDIPKGDNMSLEAQAKGFHNEDMGYVPNWGWMSTDQPLTRSNKSKTVTIRMKRVNWAIQGQVISTTGEPVPSMTQTAECKTDLYSISLCRKKPNSETLDFGPDQDSIRVAMKGDSNTFEAPVPEEWNGKSVWVYLKCEALKEPLMQEVRPGNADPINFVIDSSKIRESRIPLFVVGEDFNSHATLPTFTQRFRIRRQGAESWHGWHSCLSQSSLIGLVNGDKLYDIELTANDYATVIIEGVDARTTSHAQPLRVPMKPGVTVTPTVDFRVMRDIERVRVVLINSLGQKTFGNWIPAKRGAAFSFSYGAQNIEPGKYSAQVEMNFESGAVELTEPIQVEAILGQPLKFTVTAK